MKNKKNYLAFREYILKREIDCLVHFTPTRNLYSILELGRIMPRATLEKIDYRRFDVLDYVEFTDKIRFDDKRYINLSISGPNTFLLSKFRERTQNDPTIHWCILKIKTDYIYEFNTLYSVSNAASINSKKIGISGDLITFKLLFSDKINTPFGKRGKIQDKYTTDVQAEVLVKCEIPLEDIIEVCFVSYEDMIITKAAFEEFDTDKFVVNKEIFSPKRTL
jgi:hypothetical protein